MFNQRLIAWYGTRKKDLPWRSLSDPYAIWISEVMLQQTQLGTAWPYFTRWMEKLPNVDVLATASESEVLSLWQGLGYYRRCRMLVEGARAIVERGFPKTRAEWLRVPGVGSYTASAIASFVHREPVPAVDGNVSRVFARLAMCEEVGDRLIRKARLGEMMKSTDARRAIGIML